MSISQSDNWKETPCQLEVTKPLSGVQVGRVGLIIGLSFGRRVRRRFITIVASFLIKLIASFPVLLLVKVVVVVHGVVIVSLRPVGLVILIGLHRVVGRTIISCIFTIVCLATTVEAITLASMSSNMSVILSQYEVHGLLDFVALQSWGLGYDQLPLFSGESGSSHQMPSLDCTWKADLVILQLPVALIIVRHVLQEGLARTSMQVREELVKVLGQLHATVVLKRLVKHLQDAVYRIGLLGIGQVVALHQLPCSASKRSQHVENPSASLFRIFIFPM